MPTFVALLRAVNVGGTGKLPMTELKAMCEALAFRRVRTYLASGNVIFSSPQSEPRVKAALEARLQAYAGKPVVVNVRTADEMAAVAGANPFPSAPANRTLAIFLDAVPARGALAAATGRTDEEIRLGRREIYVYHPSGIADSKLKIPAAKLGTARNMNTVAKLAELAAGN